VQLSLLLHPTHTMKLFLAASLLCLAVAQETVDVADAVEVAGVGPGRTGSAVCGCDERLVTEDFSSFASGDYFNTLLGGYVTVNAQGKMEGYSPLGDGSARIMDSSDANLPDLDLLSPNEGCGGPGKGSGGAPRRANGQPNDAQNCSPLDNLMIIQKSSKANPDATELGGTVSLSFRRDQKIRLAAFTLVDARSQTSVTITTTNKKADIEGMDRVNSRSVAGRGQNSVQFIDFRQGLGLPTRYYDKVDIDLPGGEAIAQLSFCVYEEGLHQAVYGGSSSRNLRGAIDIEEEEI